MKMPIVKNKWDYDIIKNEGEGLAGYGYDVVIYKNNIAVNRRGAFGSILGAQWYVEKYFLKAEFNIENQE